MGQLVVCKETRDGLLSTFYFKCDTCNREYKISSDDSGDRLNVNKAAVWGSTAIGIGYSQMLEQFSALDIPIMSDKKYANLEEELGKVSEFYLF